jgi:hypothetical protein
LGSTQFRSAVGQRWNNVQGDPTRSRLEQKYGRVGLSWTKPSWPELSFTYTHSSLASALDPVGIAPQRTQNNAIEGALGYSSLSWTARVTSAYIITNDLLRDGAESTALLQTFTAVFRPLNTLTITPTMSYWEEIPAVDGCSHRGTDRRAGSPLQTQSTALHQRDGQLHQHAFERWLHCHRERQRQGSACVGIAARAHVVCASGLRSRYSRQSNRVTPTDDIEDNSGQIRLVLASL